MPSPNGPPLAAATDHPNRYEPYDPGRVRDLVEKHLPAPYRHRAAWRHVSTQLAEAAQGEKDLLDICVSLRLVLALEGVECLMK